jgi:hypothetical protein
MWRVRSHTCRDVFAAYPINSASANPVAILITKLCARDSSVEPSSNGALDRSFESVQEKSWGIEKPKGELVLKRDGRLYRNIRDGQSDSHSHHQLRSCFRHPFHQKVSNLLWCFEVLDDETSCNII